MPEKQYAEDTQEIFVGAESGVGAELISSRPEAFFEGFYVLHHTIQSAIFMFLTHIFSCTGAGHILVDMYQFNDFWYTYEGTCTTVVHIDLFRFFTRTELKQLNIEKDLFSSDLLAAKHAD